MQMSVHDISNNGPGLILVEVVSFSKCVAWEIEANEENWFQLFMYTLNTGIVVENGNSIPNLVRGVSQFSWNLLYPDETSIFQVDTEEPFWFHFFQCSSHSTIILSQFVNN